MDFPPGCCSTAASITFLFKEQNFNWLLNTPLIRPYVLVTGWPEEGSLWSQRGSDVANIYSRVRTSPVELWTGHLQWWRDQSQSALVPDLWPLHQVFDPTPGVVVVVAELKEKQVFEGDFFKPESILVSAATARVSTPGLRAKWSL